MAKRKTIPNSLKIRVLRAYLKGEKGIAELAEMHDLKPSQIYNWERQFFDNGERVFERKNCRLNGETAVGKVNKKVEELQSKLARKDAVIGTLMEELVLEKKLGGI
ncbi:MAG: transposase [Pseudobacteriovorax sp.]|nr:transposase [Pseudobacteriovorax sp.]